jgi:DNA replication protein DnaC
MAKSQSPLSRAVPLTTFVELEQYVRAFGAGHLNLLMIFGPPGVGKSRLVRQALGSQVCWIGGQATPFWHLPAGLRASE